MMVNPRKGQPLLLGASITVALFLAAQNHVLRLQLRDADAAIRARDNAIQDLQETNRLLPFRSNDCCGNGGDSVARSRPRLILNGVHYRPYDLTRRYGRVYNFISRQ